MIFIGNNNHCNNNQGSKSLWATDFFLFCYPDAVISYTVHELLVFEILFSTFALQPDVLVILRFIGVYIGLYLESSDREWLGREREIERG